MVYSLANWNKLDRSKVTDKDALVEILELAGALVDGDQCTCPFHQDRNPSAGIFRDRDGHWRFRCFVCDITYDYYDIIAQREGLDISEPLRMQPQEEREKYVYETYEDALGEYTSKYEYLDFNGHLLVTKIRTYDKEKNKKSYQMITPYYGGFLHKGPESPWPLYNQLGLGNKGVVVVEGEKCVDALSELGICATTALSSTSVQQTNWSPLYGRHVVIWPDKDNPGAKYAKVVERALTPHCPSVTIVDVEALNLMDKDDVVDYIEQGHGSEDIRTILRETAKHTPAAGVEQYIEGMIDGSISAISWPWPMLHKYSQALLPGTITLLVGPPGSSKSFMLMEALAYWIDHDVQVALHVLEENKTFHLLRALAQRAELPKMSMPEWVKCNPEEARQAMTLHKPYLDKIGKHLYAQPDKQINLNDIFSWMTEQLEAGCRIVAVDPITAAGRNKDIWTADEEFVLKSKGLAAKYGASLIFVTHPKKDNDQPYLGNVRGGAAWTQFTQNVFWIEKLQGIRHAQLTDGQMVRINRRMHILKARNAQEMETGIIAYITTKGLKFHEYGEWESYEDG